ncbi:unnamed protein product, partial [Prorocentrum cordatum]
AYLSSLQQHRALQAILLMALRLRTGSSFSSSMRQATTGFEQKAKELRERGTQSREVTKLVGLPNVHAWNAMCKTALEKLRAAGETAKERLAIVEKHCADSVTKRPRLQTCQKVAAEVQYSYLEKARTRDDMTRNWL